MSSERLPGKALVTIGDRTALQHLVERYRACRSVDKVIVATSVDSSDDPIERVCHVIDVSCYRGSLDNVVRRMHGALIAHAPDADYVFRGLGDMLLFDTGLLDWRFDLLARRGADVLWCGQPDDPMPVYGSRESPWSRKAWGAITKRSTGEDLEHAGQWLYSHLPEFRVLYTEMLQDEYYRPYRFELDTPQDLEFFRQVFGALYSGPGTPSTLDVLRWLEQHPDVARLNIDVREKTLTRVDWRERGVCWKCPNCGAQVMHARVVRRKKLVTECPRCGAKRVFVEADAVE
jgi:spore coat polysaccharide biosynthesis protein SpsF